MSDAEREVAKSDPPHPYDEPQYRYHEKKPAAPFDDGANATTSEDVGAEGQPTDLQASLNAPQTGTTLESSATETTAGAGNLPKSVPSVGFNDIPDLRPARPTDDEPALRLATQDEDDDDLPGVIAVDAGEEDEDDFDVGIDFEDEDGVITAVLSQPEGASDDEDAPTPGLKILDNKEGLTLTAVSTPVDSPSSSTATRVAPTPDKASPIPETAEFVVPDAVL